MFLRGQLMRSQERKFSSHVTTIGSLIICYYYEMCFCSSLLHFKAQDKQCIVNDGSLLLLPFLTSCDVILAQFILTQTIFEYIHFLDVWMT